MAEILAEFTIDYSILLSLVDEYKKHPTDEKLKEIENEISHLQLVEI